MVIQIKALSVNEAWQGRRFKTKKYKAFEKEFILKLPKLKKDFQGCLKLEIVVGYSNALSDLDNALKPILDVLQSKYGFNDRNIYEINAKKKIVKIGDEFIDFNIVQLE